MELLVEVKVENDLPVNDGWDVPHLSAPRLLPVLYHLERCETGEGQAAIDWIEEDVFRATRDERGIKLEFPIAADFDLLRFCVVRVIEGMIRAVVDTAWGIEVYKRIEAAGGSKIWKPGPNGPLKL